MRSHNRSRPLHRGRFFIALALCAPLAPATALQPVGTFFELTSWTRSEPLPLKAYYNNLDAPLSDGHTASTHNQLRVGGTYGPFSIAYIYRYDVEYQASRDALELIHLTSNHLPLPVGRTFDLSLRPWLVGGDGIQLGWRFGSEAGDWSVEPRVMVIRADQLLDGHLEGTATATDSKTYTYDAQVDYVYRRDLLLRRQVDKPHGTGFSLGVVGHWNPTDATTLRWDVRDLYGEVYWDRAPHTRAVAVSDTQTRDADGFVQFKPTLSGIEDNIDYTQRLRPAADLSGEWRTGRWAVLADVIWNRTDTLLSWGGRYVITPRYAVEVTTTPTFSALGLGVRTPVGTLQWLADRPDFKNVHTLRTQVALGWTFGQP